MRRRAFYLILLGLICGYSSNGLGADLGAINSGETRSSTIGPPSYMDTWTFEGQAGDRVIINAVTTSGALDTFIDLYPPGGGPREADTRPWFDQLDHQLLQTGTYTVMVQDFGLDHTGNYNISFLKIPGTVSSAADLNGGPIASGQTLSGTIVPSDLDAFQFYGQAGERVIINAVRTSGALDTFIDLYPPGGGPREADTRPWFDQLDHQLLQTGIYTILVQDFGLDHTGSYNITFLKIPGTVSSATDPDGGPITSGQTLSGTINLSSDLDAFQFYGQAGERVIINAVRTSGALDTFIDLYPPGGGPREADTRPWFDQLDHQLLQTGLYTILVQDFGLDHTGKYNISLSKIPSTPAPGIYNPSPANGATIGNINGAFGWNGVSEATGYDLYFGSDPIQPLQKIGDNLVVPSQAFPALIRGQVYYWQVVAHTPQGDIQGPYCWFLVGMKPPGTPWLPLLLLE
jgi:hypothetical protein